MPTQKDTSEQTATHTPGPWTFDPSTRAICRVMVTGGTDEVPSYKVSPDYPRDRAIAFVPSDGNEDQEANARLIAAAPDLLAALKAAQQFLLPWIARGPAIDGWQNTVHMVLAAIAQAEGRS